MQSEQVRPLMNLLGAVLFLLSLTFIGVLIWRQRHAFSSFQPSLLQISVLLAGACLYAAGNLFLAKGWGYLLSWAGEPGVLSKEAVKVYARTQLAKYIPGNVAQLVGRQILGRKAGWSHSGLSVAAVFELLSLVYIGSLLTLIGIFVGVSPETSLASGALLSLLVVLGVSLAFLKFGRIVFARFYPEFAERLAQRRLLSIWPVGLWHLLFFLIGGLLLASILIVADPGITLENVPATICLFATGWLAGLLAPGAPSGLGVREAVLTAGLATMVPMATALVVAGLLRLVTVGGDLMFFLLAGRATIKE